MRFMQGIWKLPTGLAAQAEDVPSAAEREVFEETGISTIFDRVLAIRQAHHMHVSDLFFVCGMRCVRNPLWALEYCWKSQLCAFAELVFGPQVGSRKTRYCHPRG